MNELLNKLVLVREQFSDIMDRLCEDSYNFSLDLRTKNSGNPEVVFNMVANEIPYKEKVFEWQIEYQTKEHFLKEIKAYLFDVLDGVVNL